ncbi:hypothetical protein N1851_001802 [Merluccius polli]|uniref:Ig-like domain-containing protein n=1 Tax=Merluccius polli TaxID=89951 RepID=A0AA47NC56_MERPO|nr:hypothetical protein N1851_001802 [Merluccius polli]
MVCSDTGVKSERELMRGWPVVIIQGGSFEEVQEEATVFALLGDNVALPCAIPSVQSCSHVNWNMSSDIQGLSDQVVQAGVVQAGVVSADQPLTFRLAADCSLHIHHLSRSYARTYECGDGQFSAGISLEILQMSSKKTDEEGKLEIHCSLNNFKGLVGSCDHQGLRLEWLSEANTTLNSKRFAVKSPTKCFSKLIFKPKVTDHHRTWRCQLRKNDTVKTSLGFRTDSTDGIQEVFAVAGEWVSFSCDTSSLAGGRVEWVGPQNFSGDVDGVSHPAFTVNKMDSSLAVSKVWPGQSGDYQCVSHGEQTKVLAKVRLHTLEVSAEQEGGNLTLTCLLTCALQECDEDVTLGWARTSQSTWLSGGNQKTKNTLSSKVSTADELPADPAVCSVYADGVLMASKTWRSVDTDQLAAWVALPLGLLLCAASGGLYFLFKRKPKKGAGASLLITLKHV